MMLTPKEKAGELINKFAKLPEEGSLMWYVSFEIAKKCALIAVDEIIKVACDESDYDESVTKAYWQEVKQEIEVL